MPRHKQIPIQPLKTSTIRRYDLRMERIALADQVAPYGMTVASSYTVAEIATHLIGHCPQEVAIAIHLNSRMRVTGYHEFGRGSSTACPVDPCTLFRVAILAGATAIIIAHNHPSGDPSPSCEDNALTQRVRKSGDLLGVKLVDHVIVGGEGNFYSYLDKGTLE
jgi:DNA repair protein RadC